MEKRCDANATAAGCKPGCTFDAAASRPVWCDPRQAGHPGGDVYSCAFRGTQTGAMLRHQIMFVSGQYNEVVVDHPNWVRRLPDALEAIWFTPGGAHEQLARGMHRAFLSAFPEARGSVPLVKRGRGGRFEPVWDGM